MTPATSFRDRRDKTEEDVDVVAEMPLSGYVRADLMPRTVIERTRATRGKRVAIGIVAGTFAAVCGLWFLAELGTAEAQEELVVAQSQSAEVQAELAPYRDVPVAFNAADTAAEALNAAMGREVKWSFLLNQLSFSTPSGVTLDSVLGQIGTVAATSDQASSALPVTSPVGTMTFAGKAESFGKVGAWLDSLDSLEDYAFPFLSTASTDNGDQGFEPSVDFSSNAELTEEAWSGRYGTPRSQDSGATTSGTESQASAHRSSGESNSDGDSQTNGIATPASRASK